MKVQGFRKLIVWEKSDEFTFQVYLTTKKFPKEEVYGLTSQLRRAQSNKCTSRKAQVHKRYESVQCKQEQKIACALVTLALEL